MKKINYYIQYLLFLFFFRIFSILPFKLSSKLGAILLTLIGPLTNFQTRAINNLNMIFPDFSLKRKKEIIKKMWQNFGSSIAEFTQIYTLKNSIYNNFLSIKNIENLKYIEKGGIIFSAHYGNWEVVPRYLLERNLKISIVYRKSNNPYIENMIQKYRNEDNINFIAKGKTGVRSLVKAIKEKHIIIMLVDQRMHEGIIMPFLGKEALVATGIATLALDYSLPILPAMCRRNNKGVIEVNFFQPIQIKLTSNKDENIYNMLREVNNYIEKWILDEPSQWLWFHNRWKK